jgi:glutaredoxin
MIRARLLVAMLCAAGAASALAQQLYRWTDEQGRTHITDTPPPTSAKGVQKKAATTAPAGSEQVPFELAQAMKDFPVTLYTAPNCKQPCERARGALNRRGVPFKEVQVGEEGATDELVRLTGGREVPALVVGRSVQKGFEQAAFDALLDAARYPAAGILPARNQGAPKPPEPKPQAEAKPPAEEEVKPAGPYAPRFSK